MLWASLSAWTIFLYSFRLPVFASSSVGFLYLFELVLVYPCRLLALLLNLFSVGMNGRWDWMWSLNTNLLPWAPLLDKVLFHSNVLSKSLKRPKSALLKSRTVSLLCIPLTALRILHGHCSPGFPWAFHSPLPFLFGETKFQHSSSFHRLLYNLEKKLTSPHSRNLLEWLCLAIVVFPTRVKVVEFPLEDLGLWTWGNSYPSTDNLICSIQTLNIIIRPYSPLNPDPSI